MTGPGDYVERARARLAVVGAEFEQFVAKCRDEGFLPSRPRDEYDDDFDRWEEGR